MVNLFLVIAMPVVLLLMVLFAPWMFRFIVLSPYLIVRWIIDKSREELHMYGIYGYVGDVGSGKTMSMVHEMNRLRKKYGDDILITSNFGYKYQDFPFNTFEDLLKVYDKPLIVAWDEVQNEFCSRDFQKFPVTLLTLLTQNRKGHGVRILYSCQHLSHIDKIFRDMTQGIYFCNTLLNRFTYAVKYRPSELDGTERKSLAIATGCTTCFIQNNYDRESYDSFQILQSARNRGFGDVSVITRNAENAPLTKKQLKRGEHIFRSVISD